MTSFSVIIPAFNEAEYLERCIRGIRGVREADRLLGEIVVVDNGSTDGTAGIAERLGAKVVPAPEGTIGGVRNVGAGVAVGHVLAFLDADCIPMEGWLQAAAEGFADPTVCALGAYPEVPEAGATWVQRMWSRLCRSRGEQPRPARWLPSANMLVRREAFVRVGGFDEKLVTCEDSDLSYRLSALGKVLDVPGCRVLHLREPATLGQFFRKEVWHARGTFHGVLGHGVLWRELPSLVMPLAFASGLALFAAGLVLPAGSPGVLAPTGFFLALAVPTVYTVRAAPKAGSALGIIQAWCLYGVYFAARAWSALDEMLLGPLRAPFRRRAKR